jgi:hypothetical protein
VLREVPSAMGQGPSVMREIPAVLHEMPSALGQGPSAVREIPSVLESRALSAA